MSSSSSTKQHFFPSNLTILKAFSQTFFTKMKPSKWPAKQNKKKRGEDKEKGKNPLVLCHFKAQKLAGNFAFCTCLNFRSRYFASGTEGHN